MLQILFTSDYEIHGNGEGSPSALMVQPTEQMLRLFNEYGAKLTIMADVAEILKFREYRDTVGRDDYFYEDIASQLRRTIARGHDVQLHIHASYFNALHDGERWVQDWSEYNFATLPAERLDEVIRLSKSYLENLLQPVSSDYECIAFRAANWAVSPSSNVVTALLNNGIWIDTSVFKHGRRQGIVSFDYSNAHSELEPWPVDVEDICLLNRQGRLWEMPIYCEKRWIGAFLSLNRVYRAYLSRKHPVKRGGEEDISAPKVSSVTLMLKKVRKLFQQHPWKADFNQCSGGQLIRALEKAEARFGNAGNCPFVLIGHSKLFNRHNAQSLRPFLSFVAKNSHRFQFATFGEIKVPRCDSVASPALV